MGPNTSRRSRNALRITLIVMVALGIALVWIKEWIEIALSSAMRSSITSQLLLSVIGGIAILVLAVPRSTNILRRYLKAVQQDLEDLSNGYREWSREWEFVQLSREALRRQREIAEEVGTYE